MTANGTPLTNPDVESLMEEIRQRAERQRGSAPGPVVMPTDGDSASDTVEKRLQDALSAQATFNASIVDSLMGIVQQLDHSYRNDRTFRQNLTAKVERSEGFSLTLADEMEQLREGMDDLRATTDRLNQSTAQLLTFADETGRQLTNYQKALSRVDELSAGVLATEEMLQGLIALQDKMHAELEQLAESLIKQAASQRETSEELTQTASRLEQSAVRIGSLEEQVAALEHSVETLNQSTAELLSFADTAGQQLTDLKEALNPVDELSSRVLATEEMLRDLNALQEKTCANLDRQTDSLAEQATSQDREREELTRVASSIEQSAARIGSLEEQVATFERSAQRKLEELQIRILRAHRSVRAYLEGSEGRRETLTRTPEEVQALGGLPPEEILDYFIFEQRFRGTIDEIRERQSIYLDIFENKKDVLDLGCGRGEFVELLTMHHVPVTGVDANPDMVDFCRERGLNVVLADAFDYLYHCEDGSLDAIFSAQVVEHLSPTQAVKLIALCAAKLRPAGVLVVETVNIHCPSTLSSFFLDPTHIRPMPVELLKFIVEQCSLKIRGVKYSSPVDSALSFALDVVRESPPETSHYQDYAVIAIK